MYPKKLLFLLMLGLIFCHLFCCNAFCQDDLMEMLEKEGQEGTEEVIATFKGTRVINGQSVEMSGKRVLNFIIAHRFGRVNSGPYQLFGLDQSNIRLGLDYGITDDLNIGVGRSSFQKVYDGFVKYKLLKQSKGAREMPVSLVLYANMAINTLEWSDPGRDNLSTSRYSYSYQALVARKFSDNLSLQLMPTLVHRNFVQFAGEPNMVYAIGVGGRQKVSNRVAITFEYYHQLNGAGPVAYQNPLAIGFDIETGGHVFQLHFTNARAMYERGFITETTGDIFNGDIHFGFNISRVFQF